MKPIVEWRLITDLSAVDYGRPATKWDIVWDGDPANIKPAPDGYSFYGFLDAYVGDLEIGKISIHDTHQLNHVPRITINAFSIFFPKKKNGGYGKEFGDEEDWKTRAIKKPFDLDAAKAYVEQPFFDFCEKARLISAK